MNAYELADCLEALCRESKGSFTKDAVNMLRQQADRVERKRELIREQTALLVKQNNRIAELEKETHSINYTCPNCETHVELFYKTPQIKELSDEEILNLYKETEADNCGIREFAKAILKKASEK
jgi:hypothetical protein